VAYPADESPRVDLLINNVWTDVSSYVRAEGGLPAIRITRGRANEQGRPAAQTCTFTLNNRDGRFSNRNPMSPYFGLLPRNTRVRVTAGTTLATADKYLQTSLNGGIDDQALRVATPDTAALDIVGDIEIRVEVEPRTWRPERFEMLMSKYLATGDQRSWVLYVGPDGYLTLRWYTAGTNASVVTAISTAQVPLGAGRLSIRATLDVNNGASGKSVQFFTAPTIDGAYTQLGATVTTAGTTSIFSSSARLVVGGGDDTARIFFDGDGFAGRVYAARVYNGIGGTVVANPSFATQTIGTTAFTDSVGRAWVVPGRTRITSDRVRFYGELSSLPQQWDKSGRDVWVPVTASGIIRRLTQGQSPLESPLYRALSNLDLGGYWPMEDGSDAVEAASAIEGAPPGQAVMVDFSSNDTLPGSKSVAVLSDATSRLIVQPKFTTLTGTAYFSFFFKIPAYPAAQSVLLTLRTSGTASTVKVSLTTINSYRIEQFDSSGEIVATNGVSFGSVGSPAGQWIEMGLRWTVAGGTVSSVAYWRDVTAEKFVFFNLDPYPGNVGRVYEARMDAGASPAFVGMAVGHIHSATYDLGFSNDERERAANGWVGETAGMRMIRLAAEEGEAVEVIGTADLTEGMGYQKPEAFMDLLYGCADADQGILGEARDALTIQYRTRHSLEHRLDATLDYDAKHLSEVPTSTEDDQGIVNDVTVRKTNASAGRRIIDSGPMSVLTPPLGIGRYSSEITLNVALDSRLDDIASWVANLGSVDEARYPTVGVAMHRSVVLGDAVLSAALRRLDLGDTLVLADLPSWLPPDDVSLIVQGYSEELGKFLWSMLFNTTPANVYATGRYSQPTEVGTARYDHASSTLSIAANSSTTSLTVAANSTSPTSLDLWTTNPGSFPFDIMVGGEQMTVTSITGASSPQTFTVVRGVNGITKGQSSGTRVRLYRPTRWRL
jgi:hypothetical protein